MKPDRPQCEVCGTKLRCHDCDDQRPTALDVYAGWKLLSPFGRWETVTRVEVPEIGNAKIWTEEAGERPWGYWSNKHLNAFPPLLELHGAPEVRVLEFDWADGPMYAVACQSTDQRMGVPSDGVLVQANTAGRGQGWKVQHLPTGATTHTVTECASKAKARTELRRVARAFAKEYGVQLTLPVKETSNPRKGR